MHIFFKGFCLFFIVHNLWLLNEKLFNVLLMSQCESLQYLLKLAFFEDKIMTFDLD